MAIPDYQTLMLPLLHLAEDGADHKFRDAVEQLALEFNLSSDERSELLPSGTAPTFDNRVGWARTYLKQAGLLISNKRGFFRISELGKALLVKKPQRVDVELLEQYAEFRAFRTRRREGTTDLVPPQTTLPVEVELPRDLTPEDQLASAYRRLRKDLEFDLLEQVKASSPAFFEQLVIDLLVSMGYGGSR